MLVRITKWTAAIVVSLALTVYFVRAFDSRNMSEPGPEHRISFEHEFEASDEAQTDWAAYLEIENRLADELAAAIDQDARPISLADRFAADSLTNPENYANNWNHSYEISVPAPRGVAVLLHGLTDSPYSMLATAETLAGAGYNVVVPRMPGHGFAVGGLRQVSWQDWTASVRVAVRHAATLPGSDQGLIMAGYSNGGLMAIDYGLACGEVSELPCPKAIVLMSPAISVSSFAAVANLHSGVSWARFFERFQWQSILPEVDPFKFTSFPKRAGWEVYKMSKRTHEMLAQPGMADTLPPVLAFQSVVDNTINARALVEILFDKLPDNGSELVAYDINRDSTIVHLMGAVPGDFADYFVSLAPRRFAVTLLRNQAQTGAALEAWHLPAGETIGTSKATTLSWPAEVYSLSHIALPFRPDDPVYGDGSVAEGGQFSGFVFGALSPRGERGMLRLSADYFMRTRYNPFFVYQATRLTEWLGAL